MGIMDKNKDNMGSKISKASIFSKTNRVTANSAKLITYE